MPAPKCTDQEFISLWQRLKSPAKVAKTLNLTVSAMYRRRAYLERKHGISLVAEGTPTSGRHAFTPIQQRLPVEIENGHVLACSDCHFWPNLKTVAFLAFLELCRELKPVAIICNGDVIDGATTSRHHRLGWEQRPTLHEEIVAAQLRLAEMKDAAPKAKRLFTWGNHDNRLDGWLANRAPEMEGLPFTSLAEYFPEWAMGYGVHINAGTPGYTVVKHRYKGGKYADANNVLNSGCNFVTGHDHMLNVFGWGDYTGRKWGVRTGQLSEPYGPQFLYAEDNPRAWCSGFAVLTYRRKALLPPELCEVVNDVAYFRGEVVCERREAIRERIAS